MDAVTGSIVFFFYDGPTPPSSVFAEFDAIQEEIDDTMTQPYYNLSQIALAGKLTGVGNSFRANTVPNLPAEQMVEYLETYHSATFNATFIDSLTDLDVQIVSFDTQPLSVSILEASQAQGGNVLGFDPANGDRVWIENSWTWLGDLCDTQCPQYSQQISDQLLADQKAKYPGVPPTNYKSGDVEFIKFVQLSSRARTLEMLTECFIAITRSS